MRKKPLGSNGFEAQQLWNPCTALPGQPFLAASNYIPAWRRLAGAFTPNSEGLSVRVLPAGAKAERCMKTSGKRHGMKEKFDDLSGAGYVYWRENSWRIEGKL